MKEDYNELNDLLDKYSEQGSKVIGIKYNFPSDKERKRALKLAEKLRKLVPEDLL
jgi:glutathione peroxidase-family protein